MICKGRVVTNQGVPVGNARVGLNLNSGTGQSGGGTGIVLSNGEGYYLLTIPEDGNSHSVTAEAFGIPSDPSQPVTAKGAECVIPDLKIDTALSVEFLDDNMQQTGKAPSTGSRIVIRASTGKIGGDRLDQTQWAVRPPTQTAVMDKLDLELVVPQGASRLYVEATITEKTGNTVGGINPFSPGPPAYTSVFGESPVLPGSIQSVGVTGRVALQEPVNIRLNRTASDPTLDQALWVAIRNRTRAMSFSRYQDFMNRTLRWEERAFEVPSGVQNSGVRDRIQRDLSELGTDLHGVRAYQVLKTLTEIFLLLECGVRIEPNRPDRIPFDFGEEAARLGQPFTLEQMEERLKIYLGDRAQLPYITRVVRAAFPELEREGWAGRLIGARINEPCLIELIWSYWMEEGMLVQTMNTIAQRFQNVRYGERDVLQNLEIDPLRPLNNLMWGFVQDECNRLTVRRRAYEYVHHYGLTLYGRATAGIRPADSRSKFLEAFHNLMYQASVFFKEDFQTTVIANGFPLLNALKEVHLILTQGMQNQFGDMPYTARAEMMLMQYMLSRREIRDFLQSRPMVAFKEPWEAQVDAMKSLQGWTDVTVSHFRDLAVYGEQILLSIRYGDWIEINDEDSAKNWARYFRPEIQGYIHSYRAVTGIDLTNGDAVDGTIPGILLQRRMAGQQRTRMA